jgi:uncharacterized protein with FMN-binding domain
MRRITLWLLSTVSALVLLFSYHTSTSSGTSTSVVAQADTGTGGYSGPSSAGGSSSTDGGSSSTDGSSSSSGGSSSSSGSGSSTTSGTSTYTGSAVTTRYGDVQVRITVADGKVTKAEVTQVPWNDRRDQEINSQAVPVLNSEAVDAQSADIDMVSGATYTSQGYIRSLQSAIDQANL